MKIYELLNKPKKWTQGTNARNISGDRVDANSKTAICWCINGAMLKCYQNAVDRRRVDRALRSEIELLTFWNDTTATYEDVIALTKRLDV